MKNQSGYIALISAIVISVVLMAVTFALSFSGYFARFNILDSEYKERSVALAEACADTALLRLALNPGYAGNETLTLGADSCFIRGITLAGGQFTIYTKAIFQKINTNLKIFAASSDLSIISWEEIPYLP